MLVGVTVGVIVGVGVFVGVSVGVGVGHGFSFKHVSQLPYGVSTLTSPNG